MTVDTNTHIGKAVVSLHECVVNLLVIKVS